MFIQLLDVFMYIMGLYGIISLISSLMRKLWNGMVDLPQRENMRVVLIVKDQEEFIEGVIRSFYMNRAFENKLSRQVDFCYRIDGDNGFIVVDMGSADKTLDILQKLKNTYGSLEVLSVDEKDRIFEDM